MTDLTSREMIERAIEVLDQNTKRFNKQLASKKTKRTRAPVTAKARASVKSRRARKR